ncbi:non-ribosomal peptide synthetase [Nocardia sp. NBC_01329]|uniref:non-ribosomal peptide synthetase n=1 Tax=Nocardia sp. NBC_01329 TaxID=2903594 RepID=UPI002E12C306|nr:non-ribosomal peptide synthetase [Nocardia sp. NBC_01329]WSJ01553.1 amino acid adenylation domain-containing protein [Nocardia sp. NBC_01329]
MGRGWFRLSSAQSAMWQLQQLHPDTPVNIAMYVDIRADIDPDMLRTAGIAAGRELESGYVRIADSAVGPSQIVDPTLDSVLHRVDTRGAGDPEAAAYEWMRTDIANPVDLLRDRLIRTALIRLADERWFWYLRAHHIILDGYGAIKLIERIGQHYSALTSGQEPEPLCATGLSKLMEVEATYRASARAVADRAYWAERIAGYSPGPGLSDRQGPPSAIGYTVRGELSEPDSALIAAAAQRLNCTDTDLVTATFVAYSARLTDHRDVLVNLTVAARTTALLRRAAGTVSNVVPLRIAVDADMTVADLVRSVRSAVIGAVRHQHYPYAEIRRHAGSAAQNTIGEMGPRINIMPFFGDIQLGSATGRAHTLAAGMVDDLAVNIHPSGNGLRYRINFEFNSSRYSVAQAHEHHSRFISYLRRVISSSPDRSVEDVDVLDAGERYRLLTEWNATERVLAPELLHTGFIRAAAAHPDRVAVAGAGVSWTYREFDARVNRLARLLIAEGVGPECVVAVSARRSPQTVVALYAILTAGGAFVPLDLGQPRERIDHVLDTVRPVRVLTTAGEIDPLPERVPVLRIDTVGTDEFDSTPVHPSELRHPVHPGNTAYVIFTSGSTGRPKGVAVPHDAIHNQIRWMQDEYRITADDVYLQKTAATFDVSIWGHFLPLQVGATLVVAEPDGHRDPGYLAETIAAQGVTVIDFVPSMLAAFAAHTPAGTVPTLRHIFAIGETLPTETVMAISAISGAAVHNLYGPTEAAVSVTSWPVTASGDKGVPIGVPEWNTRVYVLDSRLRPVPPGVVGELYLSGVQLARGYAAQPGLTADRFVADPFATGLRMYRTGDLARWREIGPRGVLDHLGRTDFQVKLRGQRIELGEIETALLRHRSVGQAVAVVAPSEVGDRLVAYVVAAAGARIEPAELSDAMRATLPAYMVPAAVVVLDDLPSTSNGKVDRLALPAAEIVPREFRIPATDAEVAIARIYTELLTAPRVGADDDFFELGGDSIASFQVVSRAQELGWRITARDVFEARTVAGIARRASRAPQQDGTGSRSVPVHRPLPEHLPLSPAQQRMWFLNRLDTDSAVDNIAAVVSLSGHLDPTVLRQAMADVIDRHESLRTVYPERDGVAYQQIVPTEQGHADLTPIPVTEAELRPRIIAEISAGFDVTVAAPVRAILLRCTEAERDLPEYVLVFVVHHISADGWSIAPLIRDMMAAYEARSAGRVPVRAPLPVQYADYALWHRAVLGAEDDPDSLFSRQIGYWRTALAGLPDELNLPADRSRPAVRSFAGGSVRFSIDADSARALGALARDNGATVFMVVHAAFAVFLARLSGSTDIAVGTPIAGRGAAELDDVIGMFVNTLVLRSRVTSAAPFSDLLAATKTTDLDAFSHADVPFERLVELLNPRRSTARHPLFQVALAFENLPRPEFELPGLRVAALDIDAGLAKVDLMLTIGRPAEQDGSLSAEFSFARDLFDPATVEVFAQRFRRLLTSIAAAPWTPVGDLPLLDSAEQDFLTRAPNGPVPAFGLLPEMLAHGVAPHPEQIAIRYRGRSTTYRELDERSSRLARVLIERGVGPERVVALAFPRSAAMVTAFWAVAKSGGAHVPIDPSYPEARIRHMVTDSGAVVGLTDSEFADRLPAEVDWLRLDDPVFGARIEAQSAAPVTDADRAAPLDIRHPAYMIYTSGSTGLPKGVSVTHSGLRSLVDTATEVCGLRPGHRLLHICSPSFDPSVLEWMCAAATGATLVVVPAEILGGPELTGLVRAEKVTHTFTTPAVLSTMDPSGSATLEVVTAGGDVTTPQLLAEWAPGRTYINAYGPTETTIVATLTKSAPHAHITIGAPVPGTSARVLDERLRPVPPGVAGELYLTGAGLARGYHHRPGATAGRFVADPWGPAGSRMYRTGDIVRWYAEPGRRAGNAAVASVRWELDYLGRSDFQVKIRGVRVELGEIDSVLAGHPAVGFARTLGRELAGRTMLVSYLVAAPGHSIDTEEVARAAAGILPSQMKPDAIMVLDEVPMTPNGKFDRTALPALTWSRREFRPPAQGVESIVAELFADLLGVEQVGADDDFFDLGGNSLLAVRVAARLGAALHTRVPVRTLFDASTVAELAVRAGEFAGAGHKALTAGPRPARIPPAPAQQRMWLLNQSALDSAAYNIPLAIRLTGALDITALRAAVSDVVNRHETLRTSYPEDRDGPVQHVLPDAIAATALRLIPVAGEAEQTARIREATVAGFDVTAEVPVRVLLFQRTDHDGPGGDYILLVVAHHIAVDGWSTGPLARDLMTAYTSRAHGVQPAWDSLPVQYADYTLWHRQLLGDADDLGSLAATQLAYWRKELAGLPEQTGFPTDRGRPAVSSAPAGSVEFCLDSNTAVRLRSMARGSGVTLFMVVHAAVALLLSRMSGATDVAVGVPVAGRGDAALEDLVGMFVNTVVLRTRIDPAEGFSTLLDHRRRADLAAMAHADLPFDTVADAVRTSHPHQRTPLFRVALAYQNLPSVEVELPGLEVSVPVLTAHTPMFDLTITVVDGTPTGGLDGRISYDADLFDESTVRRTAARLVRILSAVVEEPDRPVGDIDLLLDEERTEILAAERTDLSEVRRYGGIEAGAATLVDLVDACVAAHPGRRAVTDGSTTLTYAELSRCADPIVERLIRSGAGPGALVAVALERTTRLPVALLAVLRSGAGYLPIDPRWPSRRTESVLAQAAPVLVLTSTDLLPELPVGDRTVLLVDSAEPARAVPPAIPPGRTVAARADDLAYVIFTSGSTGTPKGVAVTHRNVVALFAAALPGLEIDSSDVWTVFHSFAFDFAVWELWGALVTGATAVIVDHTTSRSPDELWELLIRERVTVLSQTPTAFYGLADAGHRMGAESSHSLRYLVFGGEALDTTRLNEWYDRYGDSRPRLVNMYGITETTVHVTVQPLDRISAQRQAPGSTVGRALPGLATYVLDSRMRPAPVGSPGEIYVSGAQVARGYLGRPDLTATRFVADPAGPPGARMYRSGDLGRWRSGALDHMGRGDQQIQLRGFRVETGEIEAVLATCDGVGDARVIIRDDRLLAYVRAAGPAPATDLRQQLAQKFPDHMIPAAITVVDTWPTTVNGKLDVHALPEPDFDTGSTGRPPRTEREKAMAAVFAEVLDLPAVGIDDDFFRMGGDSVRAVRLRNRVRTDLGTEVSVQDVFETRTVAALAALSARPIELPARLDTARPEIVALSYPQQRLVELNERERRETGPGRAYAFALGFAHPANPDDISAALADLTTRHEVLRTVFPGYQRILPPGSTDFAVVTGTGTAAYIDAVPEHPFDLRSELPLRVRLIRSPAERDRLVIVLHHIAADGWSIAPLVHDFAGALAARTAGTKPDWEPLPIQYAEHATWQHTLVSELGRTGGIDRQWAFWKERLAELPPPPSLLDRRPEAPQPMAGVRHIYIDPARYRALRGFAEHHTTSAFTVLHAAFALTLREFGFGDDLAVCAPTAGRTETGLEVAVGRFTNFLVLRCDLSENPDFPKLVDDLGRIRVTALDHQDIPYEFLADTLGIRDRLRVRLAFQNIPAADLRGSEIAAEWEPVTVVAPADFDLSLILSEQKGDDGRTAALFGSVEYATDVIDPGLADRVATHFEEVLAENIADRPGAG